MDLMQALALIELALEVLKGTLTDAKTIAERLVGIGLALIPVEQLQPFLDEAARRRADAEADAAERIKVG